MEFEILDEPQGGEDRPYPRRDGGLREDIVRPRKPIFDAGVSFANGLEDNSIQANQDWAG